MALLHFPVDDSGVDVQEEAALWAGGNNQLLIIRYYITYISYIIMKNENVIVKKNSSVEREGRW